eukprot:s3649_g6.t1
MGSRSPDKDLNGDWHLYRALQKEKKRKTGWWGTLLQNDSSKTLTTRVQQHLEAKLVNEFGKDWDDLLQMQIDNVEPRGEFVEFTLADLREVLQEMKPNSAVGPDGISVSFLRCAVSDDVVGPQVLALVNHIVSTLSLPTEWEKSFLALLAKVSMPVKPSDLRPICVSSAFHKMVSKLVCRRALPAIRRGSKLSGCGKGRQAADAIGTMSRLRDVTAEWRLPTLMCKLDISGAFDKLDRLKVAEFLKQRLANKDLEHELRYLLAQLRTYCLSGTVPGGDEILIWPNVGVKQGAPESAEVFGLVMDDILSHLIEQPGWGAFGKAFKDLDVDLVFYQDDIFIIESELTRLGKRVKILERCLARAGLRLAPEKTKIIAAADYKGPRAVQVGGTKFEIAPHRESVKVLGLSFCLQEKASQQARELLGRTRDAAMGHAKLLRGRASWHKKAEMIGFLVESQFKWTAGALHWSAEDLKQANMLQLHILRSAFNIYREKDERWCDWNARSMRTCRAWLAYAGRPRWSSCVLTLQHTLLGHWARRVELVGREGREVEIDCLPMRALKWKNTGWWRVQQQLGPKTGARHPRAFYASNVERQLSEVHGVRWFDLACDRQRWAHERSEYLQRWGVKWCHGRQLSIQA